MNDRLDEKPNEFLALRISAKEKKILKELAKVMGTTVSKVGRRAVQEFIGLRNREPVVSQNP